MYKNFIAVVLLFVSVTNAIAQEEDYSKNRNKKNTPPEEEQYEDQSMSNLEEESDKKFDIKRVRIGGGFGMQFGNVTAINLSPQFGYYVIEDKLLTGVGINFNYFNQRVSQQYNINGNVYYSQPFSSLFYGGNIFTQYNIWQGLNVYGQYDLINKQSYFADKRVNVSHLLLGGGWNIAMGNAGQMNIQLLYDVINSDESVYQGTFSPNLPLIARVNFGFGLGNRR